MSQSNKKIGWFENIRFKQEVTVLTCFEPVHLTADVDTYQYTG